MHEKVAARLIPGARESGQQRQLNRCSVHCLDLYLPCMEGLIIAPSCEPSSERVSRPHFIPVAVFTIGAPRAFEFLIRAADGIISLNALSSLGYTPRALRRKTAFCRMTRDGRSRRSTSLPSRPFPRVYPSRDLLLGSLDFPRRTGENYAASLAARGYSRVIYTGITGSE